MLNNIDLNEARDDGGGSSNSWMTSKSFALPFRQITMPATSLNFYRLDALLAAKPTMSKH